MLQIDLKLSFQIPFHTGTLLSSDKDRNQLKDYQLKLGISDRNLCECNQIETVEHYPLHCEKYFNEREALRTNK